MPEIMLTSNVGYLKLGDVEIHQADLVEFTPTWGNNIITTTAGNKRHEQSQGGLDVYTFSMSVGYRIDAVPALLASMRAGRQYMLEYGPEGAIPGKPRHMQEVIVESVSGPKQSAAKEFAIFEISLKGSDEAIYDLLDGAKF